MVARKKAPVVSMMLDSGAYTAWSRKDPLDLKQYIEFIKKLDGLLHSHIVLDLIPGQFGHRTRQDFQDSAKASYENYKIMRKAGLRPIPVFHHGESWDWLERYLDDGNDYICISAMKDRVLKERVQFCDDAFARLTDSEGRPVVKVHGLGTTDPFSILRYPWASVDSSAWALGAGYGSIRVPTYKDGKPDFTQVAMNISVSAIRESNRQLAGFGAITYATVVRYLEEYVKCSVPEIRYSTALRRRSWMLYFKGIEDHVRGTRFRMRQGFFTEARERKGYEHPGLRVFLATAMREPEWGYSMTEFGANNRLLSYYNVRDQLDDLIKYIKTGQCLVWNGPKCPAQNWGEGYNNFRRLKLIERVGRSYDPDGAIEQLIDRGASAE